MARTTRLDRDALAKILDRQLDVIARDQALAVGLTRNALRHRLRPGGQWMSPLPGVYVAATGTPTIVQQQMAALLYAGQDSVITGPAALRYHRIRGTSRELVDVLIPASRKRRDSAFVRVHRTSRMPDRVSRLGPLRYALPARAVADAVRDLAGLRDVRALVADAVQRGRCEVQHLYAELASGPSVGSALFREALTDVADGIRSAAEGDLKDLLKSSDLPMPLFNPMVFAGGTFVAKPDAWWPDAGVVVEVDSREWHMSPQDHERTLERQARMGKYGIVVLPFTPRQIRTRPAEVIAQIRGALEAARGRPPMSLRTVPEAA
jgi:very-short-patch-repair endonuclease